MAMANSCCQSSDIQSTSGPEEGGLRKIKTLGKNHETLGLPVREVGRSGRHIIRGKSKNRCSTKGVGGSHGKWNKKRKHWSASESDSDWEPSMLTQTRRSTHKTKLPLLSLAEHIEMQKAVDREDVELMETGYRVGKKRQTVPARGCNKRSTSRICHWTSPLPGLFCSDLLDTEDLEEINVEDLNVPDHDCSSSQVCSDGDGSGDYGGDGECLFPEQTRLDEAESTELDVLTSEAPNCSTRTALKHATASFEEEALSDDDDEYLFCDDCDKKYHGDCPVHGPLSELDHAIGYDQASLTYTQLPVPAQLTVRPSGIPGAGLGIFAVSSLKKGIRIGPYEGRKVAQEDVRELHNMAYAWQVKHKGVNAYLIDGRDTSHSNWMRFVKCARHEDEQNVLAYQYHGNIYYRTDKTIYPKSELLVWYGEKVATELDIDLDVEASPANFYCRGCGGSFSEERSFCIHLKHSSTCGIAYPQALACPKCYQQFPQLECLLQHIQEDTECSLSFRWLDKLEVHLLKTHTGDKPYTCDQCGKYFCDSNSLLKHIRTHTGVKPFKCDLCEKSFSRIGILHRHIRTHTGDKPYKCDYCGKCFGGNGNLHTHIRTHTGDKPYKCDHCGKSFYGNSSLLKHIRVHTGDKPYKCDHCGKSFNQNGHLTKHIRTHTGDKPYKCDHCGKRFNQNGNLKKHIRTHTGDKPYKCDHCGKCFSGNGNLHTHVRTHTGEKPYKCDHCGKCFGEKDWLQNHTRRHTGEKPFKCDQCGKSFCEKSNLHRHIKTHTGDKPYKCEHCEKSFNVNSNLLRHVRSHDKPYKCDHCGKGFTEINSLQRHITKHTLDKK